MRKIIIHSLVVLSILLNMIIVTFIIYKKHNVNIYNSSYQIFDGEYVQIFEGKWRIVGLVTPDYSLPSSYASFTEDGNVRTMDYSSIIGREIEFGNNYINYNNEIHYFIEGPFLDTKIIESDAKKQKIASCSIQRLNLQGEYYTTINYQIEKNEQFELEDIPYMLDLRDLNFIILKNEQTTYISNGVLIFTMERVE